MLTINHEVKLGKKHWAWEVLQEEIIDQLKDMINGYIEQTSVVPSLNRIKKEEQNLRKRMNSSKSIVNIMGGSSDHVLKYITGDIQKSKPKIPSKDNKKSGVLSPVSKNPLVRTSIQKLRQENFIDTFSNAMQK